MTFIDTHTHLYLDAFDEDRSEVFKRAENVDVKYMLLPNIDSGSISLMEDSCRQFPGQCFPMMGLHPGSVNGEYKKELNRIEAALNTSKHIAIGEIGMDLYWDKTYRRQQEEAFRTQIGWAIEYKLPIVIHARDAFDEIYKVVNEMNCDDLTGVFHCFTGNLEQAQEMLGLGGFKLGIGGVLTFKNASLDKVVQNIDLEHLLLETDSPYLAPAPYRGKRNESSYIPLIAEKLALAKNLTVEEVAEKTTKNAVELFNLPV